MRNLSVMRFMGMTQWMCYSTAQLPLCFVPLLMDVTRAICRAAAWIGYSTVDSTDFFAEVDIIARACISVIRRRSQSDPERLRPVWTDASTTAIAAVCPHLHRAIAKPICCTHRQICLAEILAGELGFDTFPDCDTWVVDNFSAARAMVRGHSGSARCDARLRAWIATGSVPKMVIWVDTACQIADGLTRSGEQQAKPCATQHVLLRVRWGEEGAALLSRH